MGRAAFPTYGERRSRVRERYGARRRQACRGAVRPQASAARRQRGPDDRGDRRRGRWRCALACRHRSRTGAPADGRARRGFARVHPALVAHRRREPRHRIGDRRCGARCPYARSTMRRRVPTCRAAATTSVLSPAAIRLDANECRRQCSENPCGSGVVGVRDVERDDQPAEPLGDRVGIQRLAERRHVHVLVVGSGARPAPIGTAPAVRGRARRPSASSISTVARRARRFRRRHAIARPLPPRRASRGSARATGDLHVGPPQPRRSRRAGTRTARRGAPATSRSGSCRRTSASSRRTCSVCAHGRSRRAHLARAAPAAGRA